MTPSISLQNVTLDYPLYGTPSKELRHKLLSAATGGRISCEEANHVPVIRALDDVSLEAKKGDRIGFIGHNGAGKTSLLRLLAGIILPTKGTANVVGEVAPMINIGVGTYPDLTGREVVRLRLVLEGYARKDIPAIEEKIVDFAEIGEGFAALPVRTYSTGMMARLLFSIATFGRADIVLLDEWLSVADQSFVDKATKRMEQLVEETSILVLATHSPELLKRWCHRVYRLDHGKLTVAAGL
ncbi:MAG TPA: ABC transporter ATP-binding protein [Alphaproteobacteria bacterium]|nr:ABC transporter ATP-binding protein [Alphaproteobacteria bacterium]